VSIIDENRIFMVAEIGLNTNGDIDLTLELIRRVAEAGFDCVKFQKRTVDVVYTKEQLDTPRESPWGTTTREQKYGLEFEKIDYDVIDSFCKDLNIYWTASPWDCASLAFLLRYDVPYIKIASACATDADLLKFCGQVNKPVFLSTGMCDMPMIHEAVDVVKNEGGKIECIYHCCSVYPSRLDQLNLRGIKTLQKEFPNIPIGYSGHEKGVATSVMAAVLGAKSIERHVTLDRTMYGSDQAASLEPKGFTTLIRDVRDWEVARGDGMIMIDDEEYPIIKKLRRV